MDETLPSVEISVSGVEGNDTLEKHDISDLLRDLAPNDNEAVPPVRSQENLEGLVGKIDTLDTGFTDLVERSLFSPSKQAALAPSVVHLGEHHERELSFARAHLASETTARRTLEDQLGVEQARAIHVLGRRAALGNRRTSLRTTRKLRPKSWTSQIPHARSTTPATSKPSAARSASGRNTPRGTASAPKSKIAFRDFAVGDLALFFAYA